MYRMANSHEEMQDISSVMNYLSSKTYCLEHNPNCPSPYLVRLVAPGTGGLDKKPYAGVTRSTCTKDILGFGKTFPMAVHNAALQLKLLTSNKFVQVLAVKLAGLDENSYIVVSYDNLSMLRDLAENRILLNSTDMQFSTSKEDMTENLLERNKLGTRCFTAVVEDKIMYPTVFLNVINEPAKPIHMFGRTGLHHDQVLVEEYRKGLGF